MRFKERPRTVDAIRWTGSNIQECQSFCPFVVYSNNEGMSLYGQPIDINDWIVEDMTGNYQISPAELFEIFFEPI